MTDYYKLAVKNIACLGDTDIFPFPIENALFFDQGEKIIDILKDIDRDFNTWLANYPVTSIKTCVPVGYTGYRWATVIDPLWNGYLLYKVLTITEKIENGRIPISKDSVFSYRIKLDEKTGKIFNSDINWRLFYNKAIQIAENYSYIIKFDIADFYNRIYHHRLENSLERIGADKDSVNRILKILQDISNNVSYGIPIGGNASRILAEVLLNPMDQLMTSKRIKFCRFVDDYIVFAKSKEEAYKILNWCADYLLRSEGLSLQKSKTQILSQSEFTSHAKSTLEGDDDEKNKERSGFLKLHIHYDPYSITAEEDYKNLKNQLGNFDIISLIKFEVRKSRIHQAFGKQLLNAVSFLEKEKLNLAFSIIASNLEILYPIYPSVMQLAYKKLLDCDKEIIEQFITTLCKLIDEDSYIIQTDNNAAYNARVLSLVNSDATIQAIDVLNSRTSSELVKTNCLYAMTNMNHLYWLSDVKSRFQTLTKFERRGFIAASYFLGDEGKHWRDHTKSQFSKLEIILKDWVSNKAPLLNNWKLPL